MLNNPFFNETNLPTNQVWHTLTIEEAIAAMADGKARTLESGVSDETAWSVGLACGGRVEIFVEPVH